MRIAAEVISLCGGLWSACWSDVLARMVTVPVPAAAFKRQLVAWLPRLESCRSTFQFKGLHGLLCSPLEKWWACLLTEDPVSVRAIGKRACPVSLRE